MPNLSWMEMLVVGIVALIVIGPKDLPNLFRQVGQFVGKAKGMAREFSSAMNAAADESGMKDINKTIKAAANPQKFGVDKIREASQGAVKSTVKGGGETEALKSKLSEERAANAEKINKAMAKAAEDRMASEKAQAAAEAASVAKTEAAKAAPKKPADKKPAAKKKPVAKKAAAKKPAAKKTTPKAKTPSKDAK
ncbi:Sec-independent protein translocase protein TatB [Octadecabacter ascidiaceicola]|uniref:Sec-independent translocase n=1 Tax=Octadecabacter ascidiaceicola TaxID=1655543 RepID=A0A238JRI0_9RHOB|nr:Sec-independent protein translocase protein TatB [Octadecabacter ascidiaceicola]SMX32462.1 sec-independent translocase [Octadecabacter ascidiaceicola]